MSEVAAEKKEVNIKTGRFFFVSSHLKCFIQPPKTEPWILGNDSQGKEISSGCPTVSKKISGRTQRLTLILATHATSTPGPGAKAAFSSHLLKVSPLATLAGFRRRRHRHPRPRSHFRTWIVVERKMAVNSIVNGRCEVEGVHLDLNLLVTRVVHGRVIRLNPWLLA